MTLPFNLVSGGASASARSADDAASPSASPATVQLSGPMHVHIHLSSPGAPLPTPDRASTAPGVLGTAVMVLLALAGGGLGYRFFVAPDRSAVQPPIAAADIPSPALVDAPGTLPAQFERYLAQPPTLTPPATARPQHAAPGSGPAQLPPPSPAPPAGAPARNPFGFGG